MLRTILAPLAGLLLGGLVVVLVEAGGHLLFPPPEGVDLTDPASLATLRAQMPPEGLVTVLAAWFLGTFAGVWTALRVHPERARWPGYAVAALLAAGAAYTIAALPHPTWFIGLAALVYVVATWAAFRAVPSYATAD